MAEAIAVKRAEEPSAITRAKPGDLISRMDEIFDSISRRAFELFESNGRLFGRELDDWLRAETEVLQPVRINLSESDESLEVRAEVPGFTEKELEINVEPRRLTIAGKRESKKEERKGKSLYAEQTSDQILRIVNLPADIDTEKATATLKNGILELSMPKISRARKIQPKAA
jgi:HSP20 family protein